MLSNWSVRRSLVAAIIVLAGVIGTAADLAAQSRVADMPPAMAKAYAMGIQEKLAQKGYEPGLIDGVIGPETRAAIRAYQRDAGLPVDGVATDSLLDHLTFVAPRNAASAAVKRQTGQPSSFIRQVQTRLKARGYDPGPVDGVLGYRTRNAIRRFQNDHNLSPTGEVDERVLRLLQQDG